MQCDVIARVGKLFWQTLVYVYPCVQRLSALFQSIE